MHRKTIIILVSFFNVAGAQEAALRVAAGLRERGYDAETWFFYAEEPFERDDPFVRILLDVKKPGAMQYLSIARRLFVALRQARPFAVISFLPLANVLGQSVALLTGVRRRIASQRAPWPTFSTVMRHADSLLGALGIYTRAIAVSNVVKASYAGHARRYLDRMTVVHNGLDWIPSALSREAARAKFDLPHDRFIAVTLGRMKPQKNYPFLVQIAKALPLNALIVAAGDGPLRPVIEQQIEATKSGDRIRLLGTVAKDDVKDLLMAADCFLLPSTYEGQSNALLEAMNAGLPVLVSDLPDQRETVENEGGELAGLALRLDDALAWSVAIGTLARDPARCAKLSAAARTRAADFTRERQIAGFMAAIEGSAGLDPSARPHAASAAK